MTVAEIHHIRRAGSTPRLLLREDGEQILQGTMTCMLAVEEISYRCKVVARGKSNLAPRETGTPLQIRFLTDAPPGRIPCRLHIGEKSRHGRTWNTAPTLPAKPRTMHRTLQMFPQLSGHFLDELASSTACPRRHGALAAHTSQTYVQKLTSRLRPLHEQIISKSTCTQARIHRRRRARSGGAPSACCDELC